MPFRMLSMHSCPSGEDWLYRIIKLNLAQDWTCVEGWDQVMGIIEKKLAARYDA